MSEPLERIRCASSAVMMGTLLVSYASKLFVLTSHPRSSDTTRQLALRS